MSGRSESSQTGDNSCNDAQKLPTQQSVICLDLLSHAKHQMGLIIRFRNKSNGGGVMYLIRIEQLVPKITVEDSISLEILAIFDFSYDYSL